MIPNCSRGAKSHRAGDLREFPKIFWLTYPPTANQSGFARYLSDHAVKRMCFLFSGRQLNTLVAMMVMLRTYAWLTENIFTKCLLVIMERQWMLK